MKFAKTYEGKHMLEMLVLFFAGIAGYCIYLLTNRIVGGAYGTYPCTVALVLLCALLGYWICKKELSETKIVLWIFASSLALKLNYIFYTSCYMRQQDTLIFDVPMGHLGYIGYLFYNKHLPDFDTRTAWSFSHPPLHHGISAVWVKISMKLGMDLYTAIENIQLLTVFYSCAILLFVYLILKELKICGNVLYAILLITAFHPTFIIMSGSVNNDILSVMFTTGAILYAIRWYRDSSLKNILILAVMIGCAMMSKVSTGLVAVGVALVFLIRLVIDRKDWKKLFGQFTAFGVLVFPLGLWYPIRNLILFGVPLTYAEKLKMDHDQFIGNIPMLQRLTDFSAYQFKDLNIQFEAAGTYREFNVWLGLLKSAIFGYFDFYLEDPVMHTTGTLLFWMNVFLVAACTVAGVRTLLKAKRNLPVEKIFLGVVLLTFMASYLKFCGEYPHICTMNVRYIIPVLLAGLFYLALDLQEEKEREGKTAALALAAEKGLLVVSVIWSVLSVMMFMVLGTI